MSHFRVYLDTLSKALLHSIQGANYIKHRQEACVGWYEDKCLLLMLKAYVLERAIKMVWALKQLYFGA